MKVKVKFLRDYKKWKEGDVIAVDEAVSDDLHQSAIAYPYTEPVVVAKKPKKRVTRKTKG